MHGWHPGGRGPGIPAGTAFRYPGGGGVFPLEKLRSLRFLQNERNLAFWVFLVFFLPGTPKDVLCYFVGLTKMPLRTWVLISAVARIPSIITSTIGGDAIGMQNYAFAAAVFAATLAISGLGLLLYRIICRRRER